MGMMPRQCLGSSVAQRLQYMIHFPLPTVYHFPPTKITFSQPPPLFPHLSNYYSDKTLTYPSILGGHTLNTAARFMTYPKL